MTQGQCELRIANILITEWDGKIDAEPPPARASQEDLIRLASGDKLSGNLVAINGAEANVTNSFTTLKIPLAKIAAIEFAGKDAGTARRQEADVRFTLPDGTLFTLALEKLDDKGLAGATENCGHTVIPLDALARLQFHPYEKTTAADDTDDWGDAPEPVSRGRIPFRR